MTGQSETKHTRGRLVSSPYIGSEDSWFIAIDGKKLCGGGHPPLKGADADRIVLTWNCHDELVAALKATSAALKALDTDPRIRLEDAALWDSVTAARRAAETALHAARATSPTP